MNTSVLIYHFPEEIFQDCRYSRLIYALYGSTSFVVAIFYRALRSKQKCQCFPYGPDPSFGNVLPSLKKLSGVSLMKTKLSLYSSSKLMPKHGNWLCLLVSSPCTYMCTTTLRLRAWFTLKRYTKYSISHTTNNLTRKALSQPFSASTRLGLSRLLISWLTYSKLSSQVLLIK